MHRCRLFATTHRNCGLICSSKCSTWGKFISVNKLKHSIELFRFQIRRACLDSRLRLSREMYCICLPNGRVRRLQYEKRFHMWNRSEDRDQSSVMASGYRGDQCHDFVYPWNVLHVLYWISLVGEIEDASFAEITATKQHSPKSSKLEHDWSSGRFNKTSQLYERKIHRKHFQVDWHGL